MQESHLNPSPTTDDSVIVARFLALSLLAFIFLPVFTFTLLLSANVGQMRWLPPVIAAMAAPFICQRLLKSVSWRARLAAWALLLAILAGAALLEAGIYDVSYDGMAYQADAILALLNGINPLHQEFQGNYAFWTNHYPKATWYFAAIWDHFTGNDSIGKAYNPILIAAVLAYLYTAFRHWGMRTGDALLAATAGALGPVEVNQLLVHYVDGAVGSLMTLVIASLAVLLTAPRRLDHIIFMLAACLVIDTKFSGPAYVATALAVGGAALIWRHWRAHQALPPLGSFKGLMKDTVFIALVGVLFLGFNPYLTNTMTHGNPLYPLFGAGSVDIMPAQSPLSFSQPGMTRISKLAISIFSVTEDVSRDTGHGPQLKVPFSITPQELHLFGAVDIRIGAWGVLFGGIFLLSLVAYLCSRGWRVAMPSIALLITLCTILINPQAWWARYAPQVALLPFFLTLPGLFSPTVWPLRFARLILALLIINSLLIAVPNITAYRERTQAIHAQLNAMLTACGQGHYMAYGKSDFHYEQILEPAGITLDPSPPESAAPSNAFPLRDILLAKPGCTASH